MVIWYSPVGVVFLVAKEVLDMEDLGSMLASLGLYMLTVLMCASCSLIRSLNDSITHSLTHSLTYSLLSLYTYTIGYTYTSTLYS